MFPQDSTTLDQSKLTFFYLIINIHWISMCGRWGPYSASDKPRDRGRSLIPTGSLFFHVKDERVGPIMLCMYADVMVYIQNSMIPTLTLLMTCTLDQSALLANLCLASGSCSWATFIFFTCPISLLLEGPLASLLYAHPTDYVVYGHSSIHLIRWTFLARTLQVSALAASAWSCCSDPACLSIFKDLRSS